MDEGVQHALITLNTLGVPEDLHYLPVMGAEYLTRMGGPEMITYWRAMAVDESAPLLWRQRAEFFLVVTTVLALAHYYGTEASPGKQLEFNVAFLFFLKGFAQTAASVHTLSSSRCYLDGFSVARSLAGRVNLLALFSLGPHLFDRWLKSPKDRRFLDGHVRDELANHDVHIFPHLYEQFSEVTHGQFQAIAEAGYMEQGLFPRVSAIENQLLVAGKLLFGVVAGVGLAGLKTWPRSGVEQHLPEMERLQEHLWNEVLPPTRLDHLFTTVAEERHWKQIGKGRYRAGAWFDPAAFRRQHALFGRASRPKELGKLYREGAP